MKGPAAKTAGRLRAARTWKPPLAGDRCAELQRAISHEDSLTTLRYDLGRVSIRLRALKS